MASLSPEYVINGLVQRGVPLHIAQGVTARLNGESRLDPGINEIAPTVAGSRGGYGLAQWTGPRRKQLEGFAASRGAAIDDPELQLDFLMWENANTEGEAWRKVLNAGDAVEAADLFTRHWERPGKPHLEGTLATAREYSGIDTPATPGKTDYTRLAYAYANGKMTPEDEAIYERGMGEGVFPKAAKKQAVQQQQPDPLAIYQKTVGQRRQPAPMMQLAQAAPAKNATPLQRYPGI